MNYAITYAPGVDRDLRRLPAIVLRRIDRAILSLATSPRPQGCGKLAGRGGLWRIRVGNYRIVYGIDDVRRVVDLLVVAHRRDVYCSL